MAPSTTTNRKPTKPSTRSAPRPYPRPENRPSMANAETDPSAAEASTKGPSKPVLLKRLMQPLAKALRKESQAIAPESEPYGQPPWESHLAVSNTAMAGEPASSTMAEMISGEDEQGKSPSRMVMGISSRPMSQSSSIFKDVNKAKITSPVFSFTSPQNISIHVAELPGGESNQSMSGVSRAPGIVSLESQTSHSYHATGNSSSEVDSETPRADSEIYYNQLLVKRRGSPLWRPGPNRRLPIQYRRHGISIGDVGIIYQLQGFSFLFNIFRSADDPINKGRVPDSFYHLNFSSFENDIEEDLVYRPKDYLASSSIKSSSSCLTFQAFGKEGALLVMPDGALSQDLLNHRSLETYIEANAKSWYEYVAIVRGRAVKNGDIRLVMGVDKVSRWGIATYATSVAQDVHIEFTTTSIGSSGGDGTEYGWNFVGCGSGRVGPQKEEMHSLAQEHDASPLRNQCVFVRTLNFDLSGAIWQELAVHQVRSGAQLRGSNHGYDPSQTGSSGPSQSSTSGISNDDQRNVNFRVSQYGLPIIHPSSILNKYLLGRFPDAKIVITRDETWMSTINEEDIGLSGFEEISLHVMASHEICHEDGIITLKSRENQASAATEPILKGDNDTYTNQSGSNNDHWIPTSEPSKLAANTSKKGKKATRLAIPASSGHISESPKLAIDYTSLKKGKEPMRLGRVPISPCLDTSETPSTVTLTPQDTADGKWVPSASSASARHDNTQKTTREPLRVTQTKTKRSTIACSFCRERKIKCNNNNDGSPCIRCMTTGKECEYKPVSQLVFADTSPTLGPYSSYSQLFTNVISPAPSKSSDGWESTPAPSGVSVQGGQWQGWPELSSVPSSPVPSITVHYGSPSPDVDAAPPA